MVRPFDRSCFESIQINQLSTSNFDLHLRVHLVGGRMFMGYQLGEAGR